MADSVADLRRRLAPQGEEFEWVSRPGEGAAEVRFIGPFEGREIVWQARIERSPGAQFIDVGEPAGDTCPVRVGLRVAAIDAPAILKTIVMLRRYKRLRRGRHEFRPGGLRSPRA
jgi:hypothetical protein